MGNIIAKPPYFWLVKYGYGSKLNYQETTNLSACVHLPGFHVVTTGASFWVVWGAQALTSSDMLCPSLRLGRFRVAPFGPLGGFGFGDVVVDLGPLGAFYRFFFGGEDSPTKTGYRKKVGTLILTSLLEDLDTLAPGFH